MTDLRPLRGVEMESVAGVLRIVEVSTQMRHNYEIAKHRRLEKLEEDKNEGTVSDEDYQAALDSEFALCLRNCS